MVTQHPSWHGHTASPFGMVSQHVPACAQVPEQGLCRLLQPGALTRRHCSSGGQRERGCPLSRQTEQEHQLSALLQSVFATLPGVQHLLGW